MEVFRISSGAHANDLSGEGSRLFGGRWNPIGKSVIYTAETPALAMLEMVAYFDTSASPADYKLIALEIPDSISIHVVDTLGLPPDWNTHPSPVSTQQYGLRWINSATSALLKVPSVIAPLGFGWNYILNPEHTDLKGNIRIANIVPWDINSRIVGKLT